MADTKKTETKPEEQLREQMKHVNAGMLGIEGSHSHMQPMSPMADWDNGRLFFFADKASDFYRELGDGARAHFCLTGKKHDYHACLSGDLTENTDPALKAERFKKNSMADAWWKSADDPDLAFLEFRLEDAAIWASTRNPIRYAWEVQKAKASDAKKEPDLGSQAHLKF